MGHKRNKKKAVMYYGKSRYRSKDIFATFTNRTGAEYGIGQGPPRETRAKASPPTTYADQESFENSFLQGGLCNGDGT